MKKLFCLFLSLYPIPYTLYLSSCHCKKKIVADATVSSAQTRDFEKEGYVKATVIYYEIDACKYILQLIPDPNGPDVLKQLEPTNLKEEFQQDQLAVWIKYIPKKNAVSACMAGQIVELSDIQMCK